MRDHRHVSRPSSRPGGPSAGLIMGFLGACLLGPAALAATPVTGADEYRRSCAACHGSTGKGDGPVARFLAVPPTDLTTLAQESGGEFPFLRVFHIIDGRLVVSGHGDREMPVWGDRYRRELGFDLPAEQAEAIVHGRILELVNYLQSIQQPPLEQLLGKTEEDDAGGAEGVD